MDTHSKVLLTQARLDEFYSGYGTIGYGNCYISFSGGKDSTVLLDIARKIYPEIPAVFSNTGLEYPEIRKFAMSHDNVEMVQPKMQFDEVISKYGYPLIGKEVAEAIYYARKILSQDVQVERERERERAGGRASDSDERFTQSQDNTDGCVPAFHTHTSEQTSQHHRTELNGTRLQNGRNSRGRETIAKRQELAGQRNDRKTAGTRGAEKRLQNGRTSRGSECPPANHGRAGGRNSTGTSRGDEAANRKAGVNGKIGAGGAFSNAKEQLGEKSLFNKEKWLPLARDIPVMISHYCCQKIKKDPLNAYKRRTHRYPIMATMAEESRVRKQAWLRTGCNAFEGKIQSKPMSFWTEQDVMQYIVENDLPYCSVYGDIVAVDEVGNEYDPHNILFDGCKLKCTGCDRTGCIYCGFGAHLEKGETRFQRLARTHPRQYEYCMGGGQWVDNPAYDPVAPEYDGIWKNWNPKKIFVPSKKGLGLKTVFDMVNEIYGKDFLRYD